jgi:hypothetical protein
MWWWLACAPAPERPAADAPVAELLPVWGGNLLATADGGFVASDAERSRLLWGHVRDGAVSVDEVRALPAGSRPWRLAEGRDRAVWVSLRGAGAVARVAPQAHVPVHLVPVCADPRGLWADVDGLAVACAGGDLVWLDPSGAERDRRFVAPDLRDVIRVGDAWWVTTFRHAEVWRVDGDGAERIALPEVPDRRAEVAWRMRPDPTTGGALIVHQRARTDVVPLDDLAIPAYGTDYCDGAVEPAVTRLLPDGSASTTGPLRKSVLPVDVLGEDNGDVWVVSAGADGDSDVGVGFVSDSTFGFTEGCATAPGYPYSAISRGAGGRVTAVERIDGGLLVATQSPFALVRAPDESGASRWTEGDAAERGTHLFHAAPLGGISCASCHPEGAEDGHVWRFGLGGGVQVRRTQSLAGGVAAHTAPLHWDGSLRDVPTLLADTFETRMGATLLEGDVEAFEDFLAAIPTAPQGPAGPAAGAEVFAAAGCDGCHTGPWLTDGLEHDVGTGEALQTPSLVGLGARGPWMHDGCADTLAARFDPACGGDRHGATVPAEDLDTLIAWLVGQP